MDNIELGKKIKEARIAKKMTQSDVVGDFITRNMLSQIESGTATPSIKTLEYLSKVLDLSLSGFSPSPTQDSLIKLSRAKFFLGEKEYEKLIAFDGNYPPELADEFAAILARAYLGLAKDEEEIHNYPAATEFSKKALDYSGKGIYANDMIKSECVIIFNSCVGKEL